MVYMYYVGCDWGDLFSRGLGFSSEHRLVDHEVDGVDLDNSQISWNFVTLFDLECED